MANLNANNSARSPWGSPVPYSYTKWGINGELARQSLLLTTAERLGGDANTTLEATATNTLAMLLGRNAFGRRSFVTKLGRNPAEHPHHRPSMVFADAWPGYLVGGPNGGAHHFFDASICLLAALAVPLIALPSANFSPCATRRPKQVE